MIFAPRRGAWRDASPSKSRRRLRSTDRSGFGRTGRCRPRTLRDRARDSPQNGRLVVRWLGSAGTARSAGTATRAGGPGNVTTTPRNGLRPASPRRQGDHTAGGGPRWPSRRRRGPAGVRPAQPAKTSQTNSWQPPEGIPGKRVFRLKFRQLRVFREVKRLSGNNPVQSPAPLSDGCGHSVRSRER